jgi:peptidoglycan/LPS O-acetylase OafA/YrhL
MLATPSLLGIKNDLFFWLMDTKMFNFMAKISFWTYLIHYMVVEFVCFNQKTDFYYDIPDVFMLFVSVTVIAMFFGFLGTVIVENPFAKL